ncbi:hypothetical protein CDO52_15120 [Nocardiopsis gilva YIM 90087]|uniref:Tyrosine specific protein phosphatases domain-containing protein n=1 Tax=Nocardiopsis gilva YIM 90087 TaxID=1235441 RepID=A0A223SE25_9ACTN|nr:hypothetical protein CDO52_15120 [Nocardiopsis gilva YIM 90087]
MDRAAGAWVGAAAAACIVGTPPAMTAEICHPEGDGTGPARLAWLVTTALANIGDPAAAAKAVDGPLEREWTAALCRTVGEGRVPPVEAGAPERSPIATGWRSALGAPVPPLDPARGSFPCSQLVEAVWRAYTRYGDEAGMYAGALAGARWGMSGVPLEAQRRLADIVAPRGLVTRAVVLARGSDPLRWPEQERNHASDSPHIRHPFAVEHPYDPGVTLCNLAYVRTRRDAEAVVTLCRRGPRDAPSYLPAGDRVEVWLADREAVNPNLHFVLDEAAGAVAALRAEGKRVLLHCAAGQSRTPAVAAHYAASACGAGVVEALRSTIRAVGGHVDTPELARAAAALSGVELTDPAAQLFPDGLPAQRATPPG